MSSHLGLEISDQKIKFVAVSRHKKTIRLNKTVVVAIKAPASPEAQAEALNQARRALNYKNQSVVFAMPHEDVMMKTLSVDLTLTDREIMMHLKAQAPTLFGHSANDLIVDYIPHTTTHNKQRNLQVVATQKKHIDPIKQLLHSNRFKLKAIDTDAFSLARTLPFLTVDRDHHQCIALLALKEEHALLIVVENTQLLYATRIDTNNLLTAFHRAQQFFQHTESNKKIHHIIIAGNEKQRASSVKMFSAEIGLHTSLATIDESHLPTSSFDTDRLISLGAALWQ